MTTTRTLTTDDEHGRIYSLRRLGIRESYALEASVEHDGLTYSREFALDGTPATSNLQLSRARAWCKAMTADLAARLAPQETAQ